MSLNPNMIHIHVFRSGNSGGQLLVTSPFFLASFASSVLLVVTSYWVDAKSESILCPMSLDPNMIRAHVFHSGNLGSQLLVISFFFSASFVSSVLLVLTLLCSSCFLDCLSLPSHRSPVSAGC